MSTRLDNAVGELTSALAAEETNLRGTLEQIRAAVMVGDTDFALAAINLTVDRSYGADEEELFAHGSYLALYGLNPPKGND